MLDMEWRPHAFEDNAKPDLQWSEYWFNIQDAKTSSGEPKYQVLIRFVSILASLPFSNVSFERLSSQLKLIKTDQRNLLKSSSLVSLLQAKIGMKNHHVTAATLATRGMVQLAANMKTNATDEETKKLRKEFLKCPCDQKNRRSDFKLNGRTFSNEPK